jgi:hypothetical protein
MASAPRAAAAAQREHESVRRGLVELLRELRHVLPGAGGRLVWYNGD